MALNLPNVSDLAAYRENISDTEAIQRAGDLFIIASGVKDTPTDPLEARLIRTAILEMAWYITARHEDREAEFSPFSSERIGSYSYSKAQQSVAAQTDTGVPAFDAAVDYFRDLAMGGTGAVSLSTEFVFAAGYKPGLGETAAYSDPSARFTVEPGITFPSPNAEPQFDIAGLNGATGLWMGTQAEYDAIPNPNPHVAYLITDA